MKAKTYYCSSCNKELGVGPKFRRRKFCEKCNPNLQDWSEETLASVREKRNYQLNSRIRDLARIVFNKSEIEKKCVNCGYDKHIEVCHIKAISDFDLETPISEINNINNLIALCPNCHWELDHKVLEFDKNWLPENYNLEEVERYNQKHTKTIKEIRQKEEKINFCIDCGIKIGMTAHRCVECLGKSVRRADRPTKDELKEMIRKESFLSLGKKFGVSDNAIRKWCIDYGLPSKKSEIKKYTNEEWKNI